MKQAAKTVRQVLVVGATSSLAKPLCEKMASRGWKLVLCGRDAEELQRMKSDISIRYNVPVETAVHDLSDAHFSADQLMAEAENAGDVDLVVLAAGEMGDNKRRDDEMEIERMARVNFISLIKVMGIFAEKIQARGKGDMIVLGSVAGDRGRQSNYLYGCTKAGLAVFAAGMRNRLAAHGCHVLTVKPGFTDTPMTYTLNSKLVAPREVVAEKILRAFDKKANEAYVPSIWWLIMLIIRNIPESIFKKMRL